MDKDKLALISMPAEPAVSYAGSGFEDLLIIFTCIFSTSANVRNQFSSSILVSGYQLLGTSFNELDKPVSGYWLPVAGFLNKLDTLLFIHLKVPY